MDLFELGIGIQVTTVDGGVEAAEVGVLLQRGGVGEHDGIQHVGRVADPAGFHEGAPLAGITFVGIGYVGLSANGEGVDGIGHVQALYRPVRDVDARRAIARIKAIAGQAVVLHAERGDLLDGVGREVDTHYGVVLLAGHEGLLRIVAHGDVLGLHVLSNSGTGTEDAHTGQHHGRVSGEVDGGDVGTAHPGDPTGDVDHADRPLGIDGVGVVRLTLIGHQDLLSVGRHAHVIGLRTHGHLAEERTVGIEEHHLAGIGLRAGLSGHGDATGHHTDTVRHGTISGHVDGEGERQ